MQEEFLHFVWRYSKFDVQNLYTTCGKKIAILKKGEWNFNEGPDFLNAQIKIADTIFAGSVEIHVQSHEWNLHKHQFDEKYNNVILHVVYENTTEINRLDGTRIYTLELKKLIPPQLIHNYKHFFAQLNQIACANYLQQVSDISKFQSLESALVRRLQYKSESMLNNLEKYKNNWHHLVYLTLAKYLGFSINSEPMQKLAEITNLELLYRNTKDVQIMEAILFGQAGLLQLNIEHDNYYNYLKKEYQFNAKKYTLQCMNAHEWKFMRTRPANFPTIRIAQLAKMLFKNHNLFNSIFSATSINDFKEIFFVEINEYWKTHYRFGVETINNHVQIGNSALNGLIINVVCALYFAYGMYHNNEQFKDKAMQLLEKVPKENNAIINEFLLLGFENKTAHDSQSILGLYKHFCSEKKCLECAIGYSIISAT